MKSPTENTFTKLYTSILSISELQLNSRIILAYIYSYREEGRECYAGLGHFTKVLSISRSSAQRALIELEVKGYIQITRRPGENGEWNTNTYEVLSITPLAQHAPKTIKAKAKAEPKTKKVEVKPEQEPEVEVKQLKQAIETVNITKVPSFEELKKMDIDDFNLYSSSIDDELKKAKKQLREYPSPINQEIHDKAFGIYEKINDYKSQLV